MSVKEDQAASSPVLHEMDNLAVYCTPAFENGAFMAGIAADPTQRVVVERLAAALPPNWNSMYTAHFVPVDALNTLFRQSWFDEHKVTHIALLESNVSESPTCFYFNGDIISHSSLILWYSEPKQKYYFIHCRDCAYSIVRWMMQEQEGWMKSAKYLPRSAALN